MGRELNFDSFRPGSQKPEISSATEVTSSSSVQCSVPQSRLKPSSKIELDMTDLQLISAQINALKKEVKNNRGLINRLESRTQEIEATHESKLVRFKSTLKNFESYIKSHFLKFNSHMADLKSQQMGSKLNEEKIQEMLHQHHQLVQGFSIKMDQMKKIISEQEMQLLNSRAALKDTRQEIERMKRL